MRATPARQAGSWSSVGIGGLSLAIGGTLGIAVEKFGSSVRIYNAERSRLHTTTVEGLAGADCSLHPMQEAFIEYDAFQCGYCTPGQILSAIACVGEHHADTDAMIREYMSGNICRCAAYPNIVAAIRQAKMQMEQSNVAHRWPPQGNRRSPVSLGRT